jgi:hypothetical protein
MKRPTTAVPPGAQDMSSPGPVNNTAPVTQRAKRAHRNQRKQLQTEYLRLDFDWAWCNIGAQIVRFGACGS